MAFDLLGTLLIDVVVNTRRATVDIRGLHTEMKGMSAGMVVLTKGFLGLAVAAAGLGVLKGVVGALVEVGKEATLAYGDFEEQLVNIDKVAKFENFTEKQHELIALADELKVSYSQFSEIAQSAARSGFRGEDLDNLIEASVKFSAVAGDLTNREAAEGLAALKHNFQFEGDVEKLASAVDVLSDNFLATSGEILQSTSRLSGFAAAVGITQGELSGMVTVLLSAKATATTTRSTITQFFTKLQTEPEKLTENLKLTREELHRMQTGPKLEAFQLFFEKLNELSTPEKFNALTDLGLGSTRIIGNLTIAAQKIAETTGGVNDFTEATRQFNEEIVVGTNLLTKFDKTSSTVNAQLQVMENTWTQVKVGFATSSGALEGLDQIYGALIRINEAMPGGNIRSGHGFEAIKDADMALNVIKNLERQMAVLEAAKRRAERPQNTKRVAQGGTMGVGFFMGGGPITALIAGLIAEAAGYGEIGYQAGMNELTAEMAKLKDQLTTVKNIKFKLDNITEIEDAIVDAFDDVLDEFADEVIGDRLGDTFGAMVDNANRVAREAEEARRLSETRRSNTEGLASQSGPFGSALSTLFQFQDLVRKIDAGETNLDQEAARGPVNRLFNATMDELTKKEDVKPQFTGLTQAWKDAQVSVKKEDTELLQAQLDMARLVVASSDMSVSVQQDMLLRLDAMATARGMRVR